jgi:hypothetical protein
MTPTPAIPDDDLMELVRSADPLDGEVDPTHEAAESLLREILAAPRPERRPRTRPSTTLAARFAAAGVAAALAAGAAFALTGDRGGVTPASAAVVKHALAALAQHPGTILHVDVSGTQTAEGTPTITWRDQSWQQNAAPYARRQVETAPDGTTTESASAGKTEQVYDPVTNTIYTSTPTAAANRRFRLSPGPTAGTYTLRLAVFMVTPGHGFKVGPGGPRETLVITARQAKALKDGTAVVRWKRRRAQGADHARFVPTVVPASDVKTAPSSADPSSQGFRGQTLALLRSGGAHLVGPATIDGRDTLEIRSRDGNTTYYVDPATYAPVELDTTGTDGGTRLRVNTYEELPAGAANLALVSLTAQHPSATVDRDQADYVAAEERLFPHG